MRKNMCGGQERQVQLGVKALFNKIKLNFFQQMLKTLDKHSLGNLGFHNLCTSLADTLWFQLEDTVLLIGTLLLFDPVL